MLFFSNGYFSDFVYQQPDWKLQSFEFPRDYQLATERTAQALNATDTDLQPFFSRGGRIILYHGFNDPAIPAVGSIDYVNGVAAKLGRSAVDKGLRLYLAPGMLHCGAGPGANDFGQNETHAAGIDPEHNILTTLEQWVEQGKAPATLTATKFTDDNPAKPIVMTRPLCPYPQLPRYVSGDTHDAKSFICAVPKP
jgi:feruloyl esterase